MDYREVLPNANWSLIPDYMRGAVARYIGHGIPPGNFLTAVLSNDLKEACGRADDENKFALYRYVQFLYCDAPAGCWGSPERVEEWIKDGGLIGLENAGEAA